MRKMKRRRERRIMEAKQVERYVDVITNTTSGSSPDEVQP